MDDIKVSVCITTHNRENSIIRCLNSAINQTMNSNSYEIIIVDDASTDSTVTVITNIIEDNPDYNIKLIRLDRNTGNASIPRNTAIKNAVGDYILFIDSDDYIKPETVLNAYSLAINNNSDIVYLKFGLGSDFGHVPKAFAANGTLPKADIIDNRMLFSLSVLKMFKLSEIRRLNLKMDPKVSIGEDMLFTVKFLFNTKIHSVLADKEYYMVVHHHSDRLTSHSVSIHDSFDNYLKILKLIDSGTYKDKEYRDRASARFIHRTLSAERGANKYYLKPGCPTSKVKEFYYEFKHLLEEGFPVDRDKYLSRQYRNEVLALRSGDLLGHRLAIDVYEMQRKYEKEIQNLKRENEKIKNQLLNSKI